MFAGSMAALMEKRRRNDPAQGCRGVHDEKRQPGAIHRRMGDAHSENAEIRFRKPNQTRRKKRVRTRFRDESGGLLSQRRFLQIPYPLRSRQVHRL